MPEISDLQVFISHSSTDRNKASIIDSFVRKSLLDTKTFFSQHEDAIPNGNWRDAIIENLRSSKALVVVASKKSVQRPWINFEYGFFHAIGRGNGIHILKIEDVALPEPLDMFQWKDARRANEMRAFIRALSKDLNTEILPDIDYELVVNLLHTKPPEWDYGGGPI